MIKEIVFDMDGTIADLYGVENWLPKLRSYDPTPYQTAEPLVDMAELSCLLRSLQNCGINIAVITWLSKEPNKQYDDEEALIFDDDARVRRDWDLGGAIDPTTTNILDVLKEILSGLE